MTPEESELLVKIVELIVERKIQKYSLTKEKLAPTAFEERYMNHYTHGMFIDHVLFRKHLHELEQVGGVHFYDTPEEMRAAADANDQSLYITKDEFGLWQYDAEKKEFFSLYEPFGIRIVNVLPTKDISDNCVYLVPKDDIAKERYDIHLAFSGEDQVQAVRELADVKGILTKEAQEIFDTLPNVVSSFENMEEAEAELEKYTLFEKSIETVGSVKRYEVVFDGYDSANKISAITTIKEITGLTLKESKDIVVSLDTAPATVAAFDKLEDAQALLSKYAKDENGNTKFDVVLENCGANKMHAIKEVQEVTGLELKEAKAIVDSFPTVVASFDTLAEAEAELAKYVIITGSIRGKVFTGHINSLKDIYTEWVHTKNGWELVGDDLSDYYTKAETDELLGASKEIPPKEVVTVNECTAEAWYNGLVDLSDTSLLWVVIPKDSSPLLMAYNGTQWATTDGRTDTLYMSSSSTNLYKWTLNGLQLIKDDDTLRITSLDQLDKFSTAGTYKVVYLQRAKRMVGRVQTYTYSSWTLSVENARTLKGYSYKQTLTNKDGYWLREGTSVDADSEVTWGAWSKHIYAYTSDIGNGTLHLTVNGIERGTFSANAGSDTSIELGTSTGSGASETMLDFAWWQKRTANRGARVLASAICLCPLNKMPYFANVKLPLLEVSQFGKRINDDNYALHATATATFPKGTTKVYIENFGCGIRPRKLGKRTVFLGKAYILEATFISKENAANKITQTINIGSIKREDNKGYDNSSIYVLNFPSGIEGEWNIEYTLTEQYNTGDQMPPKQIRFYCAAQDVLSNNKLNGNSTEWDLVNRDYGNPNFYLLSVVNGVWHLRRLKESTVCVKRHWLKCAMTGGGIERDTWRVFERPQFGVRPGAGASMRTDIIPAFVRRNVHTINYIGYGSGTGLYRRNKKVFRWRAYDYANAGEYWFRTLKELPSCPISNRGGCKCNWYLDCLLANMRKGNQRPYIKTLCMRVRKTSGFDLKGRDEYKFYGFMEKPIRQF